MNSLAPPATVIGYVNAMRIAVGSNDVLARWGVEEFLLMMPGMRQVHAARCIERMLEQTLLDHIAPGFRVTSSAGLCAYGASDAVEAAAWFRTGFHFRGQRRGVWGRETDAAGWRY